MLAASAGLSTRAFHTLDHAVRVGQPDRAAIEGDAGNLAVDRDKALEHACMVADQIISERRARRGRVEHKHITV